MRRGNLWTQARAKVSELLDLGVEHGIINKSGTWFSFGEQRMGQGRENSRKFLLDEPQIYREIESLVREKMDLPPIQGEPASADNGSESPDKGKKAAKAE